MSQETGQYRDFSGGLAVPGDHWVWAVVFDGTFHQEGGPPGVRLHDQYSVLVIIDYRTGDFIEASIPGP